MTQRLHPITPDRIDPDAAKVVRRLNRHGFEAYLVGGCVRDLLLGHPPKDFDVATDATPEQLKALFRNCRIIGRRFRLAHIFFGKKIIETATFRTVPRVNDEASGPMIWHDNEFGTAEEDALRRDFTINGLFYDIANNRVIDAVEGLADLRARRVRMIGEPDVRTREDPVRILRAIKFASRLDLELDDDTRAAMIQHRGLIADCAIARVLEEIYKLLRSGAAARAFDQMHELGILEVLFPELAALLPPSGTPGTEFEVPAVRAGRRRRPKPRSLPTPAAATSSASNDTPAAEPPCAGLQGNEPTRPPRDEDQAQPADERVEAAPADDNSGGGDNDNDDVSPESERDAARLLINQLGLANEAVRIAAGEALRAQLEALDGFVRRSDRPPLEPVLLGAILSPLAAPALADTNRMGHTVAHVDLLVRAVGRRIHVSRRHRERLKQILVAQRRLTNRRRRRNLKEREYFPDARLLLRLRAEAAGQPDPLQQPAHEPGTGSKRRRRGRRRRGGRRRANRSTATQPTVSDSASP